MEASEAAELARERLHAEIERVRQGVEEMLDEQESRDTDPHAANELRRELEELRLETRSYVKRRVRKSEKKLNRSIRALEARSNELEQRIDQVEQDRNAAEWRIHDNTAAMLDGLLLDVRAIADRLAGSAPSPPAPRIAPQPAPPQRVGPLPFGRRR